MLLIDLNAAIAVMGRAKRTQIQVAFANVETLRRRHGGKAYVSMDTNCI